jgi:hypothetical protein
LATATPTRGVDRVVNGRGVGRSRLGCTRLDRSEPRNRHSKCRRRADGPTGPGSPRAVWWPPRTKPTRRRGTVSRPMSACLQGHKNPRHATLGKAAGPSRSRRARGGPMRHQRQSRIATKLLPNRTEPQAAENEKSHKSLTCGSLLQRGRRDSNPQPPDRQSGTLTN